MVSYFRRYTFAVFIRDVKDAEQQWYTCNHLLWFTRKCPLRGHCLAPPEVPGTRATPEVNLGGQLRGSEGDSKAI